MNHPTHARADRRYAALLRLYPRAFRREYGEAMHDALREWYDQESRQGPRFWGPVVWDVLRSAARERLADLAGAAGPDAWRRAPAGFGLRWLVTCGGAAAAAGTLASLVTWAFGYLYHPYLEGLVIPAWSYGAVLGLGLGAAQASVLRAQALGRIWILFSAVCAAVGVQAALTLTPLLSRTSATGAGPEPVVYGLVLAVVVGGGQWLALRRHLRRAGWWAMAGAAALGIGVVARGVTVSGVLRGMHPLGNDALAALAPVRPAGLAAWLTPATWPGLGVELAALAAIGLLIGSVTLRAAARAAVRES